MRNTKHTVTRVYIDEDGRTKVVKRRYPDLKKLDVDDDAKSESEKKDVESVWRKHDPTTIVPFL